MTLALRSRLNWRLPIGLLVLCLSLVFAGGTVSADEIAIGEGGRSGDAVDATEAPSASFNRETLEVGVHYMADYGGSGNLPNSKSNGYGFYNTLRYHNYTFFGYPRFCTFSGHDCYIWGDSNAWEDDWVDNNDNYVDDVDIVFYEGHGWPGGFTMSAPDDEYVTYGDAFGKWGNRDLEWAFLLSCSVIADSSRDNWHDAMDGMHGIAGFRNTAYDVSGFGSTLATHIVLGYDYKDAWFKTCDQKQPSGVHAQIVVEDDDFWGEDAYHQRVDQAHNSSYWWWWKSCGAPTTGGVSAAQLNNSFPVFATPPLSLEEQVAVQNQYVSAFEFPTARDGSFLSQEIGGSIFITDTDGRQLEVDPDTGLFYYIDQERTFELPSQGRFARATLTTDDAKDIAQQFLQDNGILPQDAVFNTVDMIMAGNADTNAAGRVAVQETTTGYQVIFNRYVTANVRSADGRSIQQVSIPVDGPGAKVKVYVDPTAASPTARVARQGDPGAVIGAMGGWRRVQGNEVRGITQVELLDYESQILPLFLNNELEPLASYENVPFPGATSKEVVTYTVSAYEESGGESQDMLYPAYRIDAIYSEDKVVDGVSETVVLTGSAWIAGAPQFMSPLAKFEVSPADTNYSVGDTVSASAVDATQTLAELGYDASLNFALGSGTPDSYLYTWFLGDADTGKQIGSGRNLSYQLTSADIDDLKDGTGQLTITLQVTDNDSGHTSRATSSVAENISVVPSTFFPFVQD